MYMKMFIHISDTYGQEAEGWGVFLMKPIIIKHGGPHCTETIY